MDMRAQVFCLLAFQAIVQCAGECIDIDPLACVQMARQNPSVCQDVVATYLCPSFCGTCTPTCYDCNATPANYTSCTTVQTCKTGEKCLTMSSGSTYIMQCASQQMCDMLSRRDLGIRSLQTATCCSSDRCNLPSPTTTTVTAPTTKVTSTTKVPTTTTTTTTTMKTTTKKPNQSIPTPGCYRDIEIMIQDSRDHTAPRVIKQYLKDIVNSMEIGPLANKIGIALFESDVDEQLSLRNQNDKAEMLNAIDDIIFSHSSNEIDDDDVVEFLEHTIQGHRAADRRDYPNVVIILVDHRDDIPHLFGRSADKIARHDLDTDIIAKDVIVINMGVENSESPFSRMATDANHVINTPAHVISSTLPKLLELICL